MAYEAEKKNGCLRGGASGDSWDDGIKMCHCGPGRTLNAEHTLCIPRQADTKPVCVDMDKGPGEFFFGEVTVQVGGVTTARSQDQCIDARTLDEKDCDGSGHILSRTVSCPCGCSFGKCNPCGSVADFVRDPGGEDCFGPEDCESRSTPTYECRGKDLYVTVAPFLCVRSKCVTATGAGTPRWSRTCQGSCVNGFCYTAPDEVFNPHTPCERDRDCPVAMIGKGCAARENAVVYGFLVPACIDRVCGVRSDSEIVEKVHCLGNERCAALSGKFQCVLSDGQGSYGPTTARPGDIALANTLPSSSGCGRYLLQKLGSRLPAVVSATGGTDAGSVCKANDGSAATWWIANRTVTPANNVAWIQLDFGSPQTVRVLRWNGVAWDQDSYPGASPTHFKEESSADGVSWQQVSELNYERDPSPISWKKEVA